MTVYIPTYQNTQVVSDTASNDPFENNYQNFNKVYDFQGVPYIISGLIPTIDAAGLVTVTAGVFLGDLFTNTDNALLPTEGMQVINNLAIASNVSVTAASAEWGHIVLRETLAIIQGLDDGGSPIDVGLDVNAALVYVPGGVASYPAVATHDTVLVGVKTTGVGPFTYELDFSQRVTDTEVYNSSTLQNQLFGDIDFLNWSLSLSSATTVTAGNTQQFSPSWTIDTTNADVDISRETLSASDILLIDGNPATNLRIILAIAAAGATQFVRQWLPSVTSIANRWVNINWWYALTGNALTYNLIVKQAGTTLFTSTTYALPVAATKTQLIQPVYVPIDLANIGDYTSNPTAPVQVGIQYNADNVTYQLDVTQLNIVSGKNFQRIQPRVGGKTKTDLIVNTNAIYTSTGSSTAYELNLEGGLTESLIPQYYNGLKVQFLPHLNNTGTTTVEIGSLGPRNVIDAYGNNIVENAFLQNRLVTLFYSTVTNEWVFVEGNGEPYAWCVFSGDSNGGFGNFISGYRVTTSTSPSTGLVDMTVLPIIPTATFRAFVTSYHSGAAAISQVQYGAGGTETNTGNIRFSLQDDTGAYGNNDWGGTMNVYTT